MGVVGVWVNPITYRITNPETGRELTVFIPEAPRMAKGQRDAWIQEEIERAEKELAQPLPPQLTSRQRHDLGGVLFDIKSSKEHQRQTGHGRWW